MWNPFKRVRLEPVIPSKDVKPASGPETTDPVYIAEVERAKLRSLLARTLIIFTIAAGFSSIIAGIAIGVFFVAGWNS